MTLVSLLLLMQLHFMTGTVSGFAAQAASKPFDEGKFEANRLKKDAEAMDAMKIEADEQFAKLRTPWKWR